MDKDAARPLWRDQLSGGVIESLGIHWLEKAFDLLSSHSSARWKKQDLAYFLAHSQGLHRGYVLDGKLVGFFVALCVGQEMDLCMLVVHKQHRRQGIAALLLNQGTRVPASLRLKRITLEVDETNTAAVQLYQKLGFQIQRVRKGYYQGKTSALEMAKTVGS